MIRELLLSSIKAYELTGRGERTPTLVAGVLLRALEDSHYSRDTIREVVRLLDAAVNEGAHLRIVK